MADGGLKWGTLGLLTIGSNLGRSSLTIDRKRFPRLRLPRKARRCTNEEKAAKQRLRVPSSIGLRDAACSTAKTA